MPLGRRVLIRNAALLAAAQGCARRIDPAPVVGVSEDSAGHVVIAPSAAPQLQKKGGAVAVHVVNGGFTLLVVNLGPELLAFDGSCPHAGCDLTWVPEDREVECPCHGSRFASDGVRLHCPCHGSEFNLDGTVVNPPATFNLQRYVTSLSGQVLSIDLSKSA